MVHNLDSDMDVLWGTMCAVLRGTFSRLIFNKPECSSETLGDYFDLKLRSRTWTETFEKFVSIILD